jgi:hypothetical protein
MPFEDEAYVTSRRLRGGVLGGGVMPQRHCDGHSVLGGGVMPQRHCDGHTFGVIPWERIPNLPDEFLCLDLPNLEEHVASAVKSDVLDTHLAGTLSAIANAANLERAI